MTLRSRIEQLERADEPPGGGGPMAGFAAYMRTAAACRRDGKPIPPPPAGRPWVRQLRELARRMRRRGACDLV